MKDKGHIRLFRTINYNSCTLPLLQCSDNNIFLSLSIVIDAPAGREECQGVEYYIENYQVCSLPCLVLQLHWVPVLDVTDWPPQPRHTDPDDICVCSSIGLYGTLCTYNELGLRFEFQLLNVLTFSSHLSVESRWAFDWILFGRYGQIGPETVSGKHHADCLVSRGPWDVCSDPSW